MHLNLSMAALSIVFLFIFHVLVLAFSLVFACFAFLLRRFSSLLFLGFAVVTICLAEQFFQCSDFLLLLFVDTAKSFVLLLDGLNVLPKLFLDVVSSLII